MEANDAEHAGRPKPGYVHPHPGRSPRFLQAIAADTTQERDAKNRKVYDMDLTPFLGKEAVYLRFDDAFTQDGWGTAVQK